MSDQPHVTSKEVSIYDIDAPLELSQVKRRDERDFPDTLMRYTNPWAICAMQDRHWLIERVEHLEQETVKASLFVRACLAAVGRPHDHADVPIGSDVDLEELGLQIIGLIEEGKTTLEPCEQCGILRRENERLLLVAERIGELEKAASTPPPPVIRNLSTVLLEQRGVGWSVVLCFREQADAQDAMRGFDPRSALTMSGDA